LAAELVALHRPGAVLLDLDVMDANGVGAIQQLRGQGRVLILALAGRLNPAGPVEALDAGANDYITRPFDFAELLARLRAAQRAAPGAPPASAPPELFRSGSLTVDLSRRLVRVGGRQVRLSATEYSLLQLFVRQAGRVLTHAEILGAVWGKELVDNVAYLRVYIMALRKKLENPNESELFQTEIGIGYRLLLRES